MHPGEHGLARVAHVQHEAVEAGLLQHAEVVRAGGDVLLGDDPAGSRGAGAEGNQRAVRKQPDRQPALAEAEALGQLVPDALARRLGDGVEQQRRRAPSAGGAPPPLELLGAGPARVERQPQVGGQRLGLLAAAAGEQQVDQRGAQRGVVRPLGQFGAIDLDGPVEEGLGLHVLALLEADGGEHGQRAGMVRRRRQDALVHPPRLRQRAAGLMLAGELEGLRQRELVSRCLGHDASPGFAC